MKLKLLILGALLTIAPFVSAQWTERHPTNVRYIAGNYTEATPFFNTLVGALNDVKTYATSNDPYVFWIMSDTLQIADWDSIYNNGAEMADSIYTDYVLTGKIKWAGFPIDTSMGGSGTGSGTGEIDPVENTDTYSFWRGDSSSRNPSAWAERMSRNWMTLDSILTADIVIRFIDTDDLRVSGDTLYLGPVADPGGPAGIGTAGFTTELYTTHIDSTTYLRTTIDQDIDGIKTFHTEINFADSGGIMLGTDPFAGKARWLFASTASLYYRSSGTVYEVALKDSATDALVGTTVGYEDLSAAAQDSISGWSFGTMGFADSSETIAITQNIYSPITNAENTLWTTGYQYGGDLTFTGDSVQVAAEGPYEIDWDISFAGVDTDVYKFSLWVDNVKQGGKGEATVDRTGAITTDIVNVSAHTIISALDSGVWISLRVTETANGNDASIIAGNFTIKQLKK